MFNPGAGQLARQIGKYNWSTHISPAACPNSQFQVRRVMDTPPQPQLRWQPGYIHGEKNNHFTSCLLFPGEKSDQSANPPPPPQKKS